MSDLISRAELFNRLAAIKAEPEANNLKAEIYAVIQGMPSTENKGEWLNYKDEHTCSLCKEVVIGDWYYDYEWYDFCPNCGCRMKGADNETTD